MPALHIPSTAQLRRARRIDLSRIPVTDAAKSLVAAVVSASLPHRVKTRPVAGKGLETWHRDAGLILGGVLKASLRGDVVSAQRRRNGDMWSDADAAIGCDAFWGKVDAMIAAGLLGYRRGTGADAAGVLTGLPSKLWATAELIAMAARHGITGDTVGAAWTLSEAARNMRPAVVGDPVVLRPMKVLRDGYWQDDRAPRLEIPEADQRPAATIRNGLARLNGTLAAATIQGIRPPVFRRTFVGDLRIGGRFFTIGGGSFSNAPTADRRAMTINGEAVAEVDVRASQITAFLAMTDPGRLEGRADPYELDGLPREAVKSFLVQTFGTGRPIRQWAGNTRADVRRCDLGTIRRTVLQAYPSLEDISAILPADLKATIAPLRHPWAAGQHLVSQEAEMLSVALSSVLDAGVVALPLHDALVVPAGAVEIAAEALRWAWKDRFGVVPNITASRPTTGWSTDSP